MTTQATLDPILIEVAPGGEAIGRLLLRNGSDIVEEYDLTVLGEAAAWTVLDPPTVRLYPGAEAAVAVAFRPPRSAHIPAVGITYAVHAVPSERPQDEATAEGVVQVLPFAETTAEINPRTSRGVLGAGHEVAVDNRGNAPISATLAGTDPDGQLRIRIRPSDMTVPPGEAAFAGVQVRTRRVLWRGQPRNRPFRLVVSPDGERDIVLDAATLQTPVVSKAAARVLAALAVLVLLAVAGWFLLLKPAVRSAAKDAVEARMPAGQLGPGGETSRNGGGPASGASPSEGGGNGPATSSSSAPVPLVPVPGSPVAVHVQAGAGAGGANTGNYVVPAGTTLVLTDIVLQNPQGDTGRIDVVVDNVSILTLALANFRDLDYHFVSPIEVPAGKTVGIRISCQAPGPVLTGTSGSQCREWMFGSGTTRKNP
jgi:hypothetical protein